MNTRNPSETCVLVIIADGFDEAETISILSALRDAGVYVKSVGVTSGLINGVHGISLMPDFTLFNLQQTIDLSRVNLVVLPGGERSFAQIEPDPRVHRIIRQVLGQKGFVATSTQGQRVLRTILGLEDGLNHRRDDHILLQKPYEESIDVFAQTIVRRLQQPL